VNAPIRRVFGVVMVMFVVLMIAVSTIQYVQASSLNADGRNVRTLYREVGRDRGPIIVAGEPVAVSVPVDDAFGALRTYPGGALMAPVTGYFSVVNGITGIERTENSILNGTSSSLLLERIQALFTGRQPQGGSVELTLNPAAQQAGYEAFGDQIGGAVAIDPRTGAVLALVTTPSFDPNRLASHDTASVAQAFGELTADPDRPLDNKAIAGRLYPPGSTMKLITTSALLETGDYSPQTQVPAPDSYQLPGSTAVLGNPGGERCGSGDTVTLEFALQISCNTPFAILGVELGDDVLRRQAEAYGFGRELDIPLPVTPSIFPADPDPAQTAMSAIGQFDVRASPIQMAMVSAAIANGGELMKPYLVARTRGPDLTVISETQPQVFSEAISGGSAAQLRDMMVNVVENGTGRPARIPGVQVAGKTGTAQTSPGNPPHAWFTAFAPADDPQVAVAVVVESGGSLAGGATGARVAAPIAKAIMEAVLAR
jgi:peptidoglycan glycosyltransferase